jgi:recombination protein RecR
MYSRSITNLINAFKHLPSVGARTAERYVFYLLKSGKGDVNELKLALEQILTNTRSCEICWNFADITPCPICTSKDRDHTTICVVADPQDIPALEKTGAINCVYHVLRGTVDPLNNLEKRTTKIKELMTRLKKDKQIKEIILALNPDMAGETTMLYLENLLKKINSNLKITRLARGLPMGSDLQYADEITLGSALKNRQ